MDQVLFGLAGFLIGLAVLYGVVRLALSPREIWLAPPSGRPHQSYDSIPGATGAESQDWSGGHHHAP